MKIELIRPFLLPYSRLEIPPDFLNDILYNGVKKILSFVSIKILYDSFLHEI